MSSRYRFVYRRLLAMIPTLFFASTLVWYLTNVAPGNAAEVMLGPGASQTEINGLEAQLGLNKPLPVRYYDWLSNILHGSLGTSLASFHSVNHLIVIDFPITMTIAVMALAIALAIGIPTGVIAARRRGSLVDLGASSLALAGVSIPGFWLGILLIEFFSVDYHLLPATGLINILGNPKFAFERFIMPAIMLGVAPAAFISRMTRSSLIEVLSQDYVTTARAKGLANRVVLYRHALKNALVPVSTVVGFQFGGLLGGSIIAEQIFGINGMGQLLFQAIEQRDYVVVAGASLVFVLVYLLVNVVVDMLYMYFDPRVRFD